MWGLDGDDSTNHCQGVKSACDTGICPRQHRLLVVFLVVFLVFLVACRVIDHAVQNRQQNAWFMFAADQFIDLLDRDQFTAGSNKRVQQEGPTRGSNKRVQKRVNNGGTVVRWLNDVLRWSHQRMGSVGEGHG